MADCSSLSLVNCHCTVLSKSFSVELGDPRQELPGSRQGLHRTHYRVRFPEFLVIRNLQNRKRSFQLFVVTEETGVHWHERESHVVNRKVVDLNE